MGLPRGYRGSKPAEEVGPPSPVLVGQPVGVDGDCDHYDRDAWRLLGVHYRHRHESVRGEPFAQYLGALAMYAAFTGSTPSEVETRLDTLSAVWAPADADVEDEHDTIEHRP